MAAIAVAVLYAIAPAINNPPVSKALILKLFFLEISALPLPSLTPPGFTKISVFASKFDTYNSSVYFLVITSLNIKISVSSTTLISILNTPKVGKHSSFSTSIAAEKYPEAKSAVSKSEKFSTRIPDFSKESPSSFVTVDFNTLISIACNLIALSNCLVKFSILAMSRIVKRLLSS